MLDTISKCLSYLYQQNTIILTNMYYVYSVYMKTYNVEITLIFITCYVLKM